MVFLSLRTAKGVEYICYGVTKVGIIRLTEAMAVDLGQHGIRCNSIRPGYMNSDHRFGSEATRRFKSAAFTGTDFLYVGISAVPDSSVSPLQCPFQISRIDDRIS